MMDGIGLTYIQEHRFHPVRRWRFDYYFPTLNVAFEYDGLQQGHTGVAGVLRDSDKINEAQVMGICVYRANAKTVANGTAADLVARVVEKHGTSIPVAHKGQRNRKVLDNQAGKGGPSVQAKRQGTRVPNPRVRDTGDAGRDDHDQERKGTQ